MREYVHSNHSEYKNLFVFLLFVIFIYDTTFIYVIFWSLQ